MAFDGHWDIVITSLQDICNSNESVSFDYVFGDRADSLKAMAPEDLAALKDEVLGHRNNIQTSSRVIETCQENLATLITRLQKAQKSPPAAARSRANSVVANKPKTKVGRSYHVSKYNTSEPIVVGAEVAYRLKNRHTEEWIQCEVTKIIGDGIKFEVRDPEPDENNNPGQTFKANYKEIIAIPESAASLPHYPYAYKVLARYPETTTFYPAVVVGHKKDGRVRLKFDGEEEANKETEVDRKHVLPFPEK